MGLKAAGVFAELDIQDFDVFLIGYGPGEPRRPKAKTGLRLRAIVLEDASTQRIALIAGDLWAASSRVLEHIRAYLKDRSDLRLDDSHVFFSGTHTHCSIGEIYESSYYATFAGSWIEDQGFDDELAESVAAQFVGLIEQACLKLEPAALSTAEALFQGNSINRSYAAFVRNNLPGTNPDPAAGEDAQRAVINPSVRLVKLTALADPKRVLGVWGTVHCHGTALGRNYTECSPDFIGTASKQLEEMGGDVAPWVLASGATGDVDPQPAGLTRAQFVADRASGPEKSIEHMHTLATALQTAVRAAPFNTPTSDVSLTPLRIWAKASQAKVGDVQLPQYPEIGDPVLRGSELGRGPCSQEGAIDLNQPDGPQFPKVAQNPATLICNGHLRFQPQYLALSVFKLGNAMWLVGLPGEPTTTLARNVVARLQPLAGATPIMICGLNGGYNGYFVTEPEFASQQYEGASCIWGRYTEPFLLQQLEQLATPIKTVNVPAPTPSAFAIARPKPKPKPRAERPSVVLVPVRRFSPAWDARLEIEVGHHIIHVPPADHRTFDEQHRILFLVDKRLLKYRGRLIDRQGKVVDGWKPLTRGSAKAPTWRAAAPR